MHKDLTIYKIYKELEEKRQRLRTQLDSLDVEENKLREQCPHSLAIKLVISNKYNLETGYIMCPICNRIERIGLIKLSSSIKSDKFEGSKVIDLSELQPKSDKECLDIVKTVGKIIVNDPEYYYSDLSTEELTESFLQKINYDKKTEVGLQRKREI